MSSFIGQENLFKIINNFNIQNLPHTLLFLGEAGCGKKTVVKYLANKLGLSLIVIDNKTDSTTLIEYQQRAVKALYLLDLSELNLEKDQNKYLKFIEEPGEAVYIALINNSEIGILPTILNRCQKIRFEPYSINQLKQIKNFDNDLAYKVCKTPGQLNNIDAAGLTALYNTCKMMLVSSYEKLLSVAAKINYKDEYSKFDFDTFFNMLEIVLLDEFKTKDNKKALQAYLYTIKRRQELLQNSKIQKEAFVLNFLTGFAEEIK